jgi:hypothetical protein
LLCNSLEDEEVPHDEGVDHERRRDGREENEDLVLDPISCVNATPTAGKVTNKECLVEAIDEEYRVQYHGQKLWPELEKCAAQVPMTCAINMHLVATTAASIGSDWLAKAATVNVYTAITTIIIIVVTDNTGDYVLVVLRLSLLMFMMLVLMGLVLLLL